MPVSVQSVNTPCPPSTIEMPEELFATVQRIRCGAARAAAANIYISTSHLQQQIYIRTSHLQKNIIYLLAHRICSSKYIVVHRIKCGAVSAAAAAYKYTVANI